MRSLISVSTRAPIFNPLSSGVGSILSILQSWILGVSSPRRSAGNVPSRALGSYGSSSAFRLLPCCLHRDLAALNHDGSSEFIGCVERDAGRVGNHAHGRGLSITSVQRLLRGLFQARPRESRERRAVSDSDFVSFGHLNFPYRSPLTFKGASTISLKVYLSQPPNRK